MKSVLIDVSLSSGHEKTRLAQFFWTGQHSVKSFPFFKFYVWLLAMWICCLFKLPRRDNDRKGFYRRFYLIDAFTLSRRFYLLDIKATFLPSRPHTLSTSRRSLELDEAFVHVSGQDFEDKQSCGRVLVFLTAITVGWPLWKGEINNWMGDKMYNINCFCLLSQKADICNALHYSRAVFISTFQSGKPVCNIIDQ